MCLYGHANKARCCCCCCLPLHCGVGVIRHLCLQRVCRKLTYLICPIAVADSDLQRGGSGHPDPEIRGGEGGLGGLKRIFSALRASFWSKNKEMPGSLGLVPRAPPLDPPLKCTAFF